jgi:hypothetical protein
MYYSLQKKAIHYLKDLFTLGKKRLSFIDDSHLDPSRTITDLQDTQRAIEGVRVGVFNVDENKRAFGFDRKSDSKITPTKPAMLYKEPKERQNSSTSSNSSSSSKCWERGGRGSGVISLPGPI